MGDYLNPKGPDEDMPDIRSSVHIEVATHGDETKDVKILRILKAPTENVPLPVAHMEMLASEVPPPVRVAATKHINTIGHVSIEATQGEASASEVSITTLISARND